ncbi:enoyl-CoA hydratase/isomerase family protein [Pseudenhygromyxa sp. WMMC2535]|uniref:enoyl-CoA hydratase-related protein n=1 Tax=Pseudenhygromyxa sp. WMMC2535 TaxID=2712867 RepID=UPI001555C446|nr:enoyl-CoA hydratase-related protein [Pseudenhygromyxa sp. WMMC2535]NVB40708.1 enoyl-CoA hydratase/isomerase family protein [Pseudenhygromyxa sp. WMMC2535]
MSAQTIALRELRGRRIITFDRPDAGNSFTAAQLEAIAEALDDAERDQTCKMVIFEGRGGYFCRGLDFRDGLSQSSTRGSVRYLDLLERLRALPLMVVAHVDGQVLAGGLGFVAASDYAIASPRSTFGLPEATWGLVPACVGLALERRIGRQWTLRLSLTTQTLDAATALGCALVDEVDEAPEQALRRLWLKIARIERGTIGRIKRYFDELPAAPAARRAAALAESDRQMSDPSVRAGISAWVEHGRFPWER